MSEFTPGICLSVIMKNEEHVLERMMNSVYKIIDHYIVVDTGSTDNSIEIVENFFKEKGIPGKVIKHEWVNFETARNLALQEAKKTKMSHSFWIDCDEQLITTELTKKENIVKILDGNSSALINVNYGSASYTRKQFYSNTHDFYWSGPVHEVLKCHTQDKPIIISGISVLVTPDGSSWTSQTLEEKYSDHAKILEEYVANDETKDPRWIFYLAQSYRDAGTIESLTKSIEWYEKRTKIPNGTFEEIYFSQYMIATIKSKINIKCMEDGLDKPHSFSEIADDLLKCSEFDNLRAEHFVLLAKYYHSVKRYQSAYIITHLAYKNFHKKSPYPQRALFVDPQTYIWKIADVHAISCYWTNRFDECKKVSNQITKAIQKNEVKSEKDLSRLKANLEFYRDIKNLKDKNRVDG